MEDGVNKAIILGSVGRDPEIRHTQGGKAIASFSVACDEQWKDAATGEKRERTEWVSVVCFNDHISDVIQKYVKKGARVYVEGKVRTRQWTDRQGEDRFSTEVLEQYGGTLKLQPTPKPRSEGQSSTRQPNGTDQRGNPRWDEGSDEIPF